MKTNKKIIASLISLVGISSIFVNMINYKTIENSENETRIKNEEKNINNNEKQVFIDSYSTAFTNRFVEPVISKDPTNPGFLGIDKNFLGSTLVWTGTNLFTSWAQDISNHPDLVGSAITTPFVVSAVHSDFHTKDPSTIKKNQIYVLVGDSAQWAERRFAIIRYNAINGTPISNTPDNVIISLKEEDDTATGSLKAPTEAQPGVFANFYDEKTDKIVFYRPGTWQNVKDLIFSVSINRTTDKFSIQKVLNPEMDNAASRNPFNADDKLGAIAASPIGSTHDNYIFLMFKREGSTRRHKPYLSELNNSFQKDPRWDYNSNTISFARSNVINSSETTDGEGYFYLQHDWIFDNWVPNLEIQMIGRVRQVSSLINTPTTAASSTSVTYAYINRASWITNERDTLEKKYVNHNSGVNLTSVKNVSSAWKRSGEIDEGKYFPFVKDYKTQGKYNITVHNAVNVNRITPMTLSFLDGVLPTNASQVNGTRTSLLNATFKDGVFRNWSAINIPNFINNDSGDELFYTILPQSGYISVVGTNGAGVREIMSSQNGGYNFIDPNKMANDLGWLASGSSPKTPSQIVSNITLPNQVSLIKDDITQGDFFSNQNALISFPTEGQWTLNLRNEYNVKTTIIDNLTKDDSLGTIGGSIKYDTELTDKVTGEKFNTTSNIIVPEISGFLQATQPTELTSRNTSNILASDLTTENIDDYFVLTNLTPDVTAEDITWRITNQNNILGTANVSATVPRYRGPDGNPVNTSKTFSLTSNFKKNSGTDLVRTSTAVPADWTVWDLPQNRLSEFANIVNPFPGSTVEYSATDFNPLDGILSIEAKVIGNYYDKTNNALPTTNGLGKIFKVSVTGFKRVVATTIATIPGNPALSPEVFESNPQSLLNYLEVSNEPTGTIVTITNAKSILEQGQVRADVNLSKYYDDRGFLEERGRTTSILFGGFGTEGIGVGTNVFPIDNKVESNKKFSSEVNETNVSNFIAVGNMVPGTIVTYEFLNAIHVSPLTNGGYVDVVVTVDKYKDSLGEIVNQSLKFEPQRISGFKSVSSRTYVNFIDDNSNEYAQYMTEDKITNILTITNPSPIIGSETSIRIETETMQPDNRLGQISFNYYLNNFFNEQGFLIKEETIGTALFTGFKRVSPTTLIEKTSSEGISNILPSNFIANDWNKYFSLNATSDENINIIPLEGLQVTKKSFNDATGSVILTINGLENFVDKDHIIINSGALDIELFGFAEVKPVDNTLFIIIGSVGGVLLLIIIIAIIIWLILRKKNEEELNSTNPASNGGATPPGGPRPTTMLPQQGPPPPGGPRPTTMVPQQGPPLPGGPRPTTMVPQQGPPPPGGPRPTTMLPQQGPQSAGPSVPAMPSITPSARPTPPPRPVKK